MIQIRLSDSLRSSSSLRQPETDRHGVTVAERFKFTGPGKVRRGRRLWRRTYKLSAGTERHGSLNLNSITDSEAPAASLTVTVSLRLEAASDSACLY